MAKQINFNRLTSLLWGTLTGTLYLFANATTANALTFILDFNDTNQPNTSDIFGTRVTTFALNPYGFATTDFDLVTNSILNKVESHFYNLPTESNYFGSTTSPIPDGKELDVDFEIGDINEFTPSNEDRDYYFLQIGSAVSNEVTYLGQAGLNTVRTSSGTVDPFGIFQGQVVGSVFTNNINRMGGLGNGLKSGNLEATTNAIAGTLSHEIAHALSLHHVYKGQSETFGDVPPLLGTGALDLPNRDRIIERAFSFSALGDPRNSDEVQNNGLVRVVDAIEHTTDVARNPFAPLSSVPANAPTVNHVEQLVNVIGLRDTVSVPGEFSPIVAIVVGGIGLVSLRKDKTHPTIVKTNITDKY